MELKQLQNLQHQINNYLNKYNKLEKNMIGHL